MREIRSQCTALKMLTSCKRRIPMTTSRNRYYLLNPIFLACLITLLLNDHYLKYTFPSWLTGKLSDVTGIIILPLLIAFISPKLRLHATWISAVFFVFWKSSLSQELIDVYSHFSPIETSRVVDVTDLFALLFLPLPHFLIRQIDTIDFLKIDRVPVGLVVVPSIVALMATSPPSHFYYTRTKGNLACSGCNITVHYTQDQVIEKLKKADIVFDSIAPINDYALQRVSSLKNENVHVYRLNRLIIDKDTLRNLDFTMRTIKDKKTVIYFNGMQVSKDISDYALYRKLRKYYRKVLFKKLKNSLDE